MPRKIIRRVLLSTLPVLLLACGGEENIGTAAWMSAQPDAQLAIKNPNPDGDEIRAIIVEVTGLAVHHAEEGWIAMRPGEGWFNLLDLGRMPYLLAWSRLPDGGYDQIRFQVGYALVVVGDIAYPLEIPSGETSGFKIHTRFCMEDGQANNLQLQWKADEALHYNENRGYWLTPSIQIWSPPTCVDDVVNRPDTPVVPR